MVALSLWDPHKELRDVAELDRKHSIQRSHTRSTQKYAAHLKGEYKREFCKQMYISSS